MLIAANADLSPAQWLNQALDEARAGDTGGALARMRALEVTWPEWDEPVLRQAETLRAAGDTAAATLAYNRVLEIDPARIEALIGLGVVRIGVGDGEAAQMLLLRACGVAPRNPQAWDALGLALLLTADHRAAESAFAEAQRLAPRELDYALHRIDAACLNGTGGVERMRLSAMAFEDPLDALPPTALGMLLERLDRRNEAIDALEVATILAPEAAWPAACLAGLLARSHRLREAEPALARAIALQPGNLRLRNDHATVLMRMHRHEEAREVLQRLLDEAGPDVTALCNLANATVSLGRQEQGEAAARQAIALIPDAVLPRRALCNVLPYRHGIGGAELLAALRDCAALLPRPADIVAFANPRDPGRRLRIGLLSGSLRTHPVGWLTIAGFEALDPQKFEIVCLGRRALPDPIAARFAAIAAEWHETDRLDDAALAAEARALRIDVAIDLGGYGDAGRLPACAHRLAPVQIKWVGMQNHSTGVADVDFFLTDAWETPVGFERFYSERLLRLPDGYVCYSPPSHAPDIGSLPAARRGAVTFGCFNNLAKITPRVIAAWGAILRQIPRARLVLKTHQFAEAAIVTEMTAAFAAEGIAASRTELRGASAHRAFLGEYNDIDIALDPFPYSGGLTTCEALWMGVPTITLPGETFASRHSASHLSNVGLGDWVAADISDYIEMAVERSHDLVALAALRAGLRARTKASPLCDGPRFGHGLAAALRHAWADWCERHEDIEP